MKEDEMPKSKPDTNQDYLRVLDFGGVGDGEHDDTDAIQAAIDSLVKPKNQYGSSASGGPVCFSPGKKYKTTRPIEIRCRNLTLFGRNGRDQTARNTWIYSAHDGPAFVFPSMPNDGTKPAGFRMEGLLIVGKDWNNNNGSCAFEIHTGQTFLEKLSFERVAVSYFSQGWRIVGQPSYKQTQIGEFSIADCAANWCGQSIVFQNDTSANLFCMRGTDCSHTNFLVTTNTDHTLYSEAAKIRAFQCSIGPGNNFEGVYNALRIRKSDTVWCKQNFFEKNTGAYCIHLEDSTRFEIGYNRYYKPDTDNKVVIVDSTEGYVRDRPAMIINSPGVT